MRSGLGEVTTPLQELQGLEGGRTLPAGNGLSSEATIVLFAAELPGRGREGVEATPVWWLFLSQLSSYDPFIISSGSGVQGNGYSPR